MSEPFPFRRPGQPWPAYVQAISRFLANPVSRAAAVVRATGSGHGGDDYWCEFWNDSDRVARRLREYLCWRLAPHRAPEAPAATADLDAELFAAVNALGAPGTFDVLAALRGSDPRAEVARLRDLGASVLRALPELGVPAAGPPRAVTLDGDAPERVQTEVERVAPGVGPGPMLIAALVAAALRGDLDFARLPPHLVVAVRARLLENASDLAVEARLPAAMDPDADPEALLADLLGSPEFQAAAGALRAALDGVALAMAPGGGYGNGG